MPLHLLGKKSWNVYSPANIARVRRDEAEAQAREEAQERRMQEIDAARRLAILRGEIPPPLEDAEPGPPSQIRDGERDRLRDDYSALTSGRKRRRRGEDDTDFEMRIARERAAVGDRTARELAAPASLIDSKGHLTLFAPPEPSPPRGGKDDEAAHREREDKDQYQMRFVNAAGRDGQGLTDGGPWYASRAGVSSAALAPSKNVFGQEDPRRKERAAARLDASDPLAIMKQGAKMVRELEKERRREAEERERELRALEREERRRERKRRKREDEGEEEEEVQTGKAIPPGGSGHIGIATMGVGNGIDIAAANARELAEMRETGLTDERTPTKITRTDAEMEVGSGVGGRKKMTGVSDRVAETATEHAGHTKKKTIAGR
ncbi:uncharacterized protein P884DRAFT_301701 [Thermothelomyces heterothallicus CBS 202.75]|uniref:uncharacterized protein n=1 Tax=Thermothelomyces heterothallicus CBS 202.75 TaxID=1149848 RepID=UPI00374384B5